MLDKAGVVGDSLCQGKNDYKKGGMFYGTFLAAKIKHCLTIKEFGIIKEHETIKSFIVSKRRTDRSHCFNMIDGRKSAMLPRSWKKSFNSGVVIPAKLSFCKDCGKKML